MLRYLQTVKICTLKSSLKQEEDVYHYLENKTFRKTNLKVRKGKLFLYVQKHLQAVYLGIFL